MKDSEIVALYWKRSEDAITQTKEKYGWYCTSIAYRILSSIEDSEECVSDAFLRVWNSIPPNEPKDLRSYIGKITRNLSLNRLKANSVQKRGEVPLVLEELEIASLDTVENELERKRMSEAITGFLRTLPTMKRRIFVLRYWYFEPISAISSETGWKENRIKVELYRLRQKLAAHLEKEGFTL